MHATHRTTSSVAMKFPCNFSNSKIHFNWIINENLQSYQKAKIMHRIAVLFRNRMVKNDRHVNEDLIGSIYVESF